tara:strand:+ start:164 stop:337 length:174 start_codon:yes stop_codon:yes gene_type:complete
MKKSKKKSKNMRIKYLKLLNKHKDTDTLDVLVAKELINAIFDDLENNPVVKLMNKGK